MTQSVKVARLDVDRIYFGLDEKPLDQVAAGDVVFGPKAIAEDLPAGAVYVGADCDLPGGRYRWDGKSFLPLPPSQQKKAETAPDHERATYELCRCLHEGGNPLSKPVRDWAIAYERSFDAQVAGDLDAGPVKPLDYFRNASPGGL